MNKMAQDSMNFTTVKVAVIQVTAKAALLSHFGDMQWVSLSLLGTHLCACDQLTVKQVQIADWKAEELDW